MLDAETLDQLYGLTTQQVRLEQYQIIGSQYWVKMAESYPQPRVVGIADCYRVKLRDLIDFWFSRDWQCPSASTCLKASIAAQLGEGNGEEEQVFVYNEYPEPRSWMREEGI